MKELSKLKDFDAIKIYLASTEDILSWSFGEITKPETINYRTFKSEKDGLFDERIFGPAKNFECYCGKYKGIRYKGVICDKCGVEVVHSKVRRERMGHIKLACPVAHVWFFRGIPSKMALLLNLSPRNIESIVYFSSFIVTEIDGSKKAQAISRVEEDIQKARQHTEKEIDAKAKELEKQFEPELKAKDELKVEEARFKLNQKIASLRKSYEEKTLEAEKTYKLIQKKIEGIDKFSVISENEYLNLFSYINSFCTLAIGAEALLQILTDLDLNALTTDLRDELARSKGQKALKIAKRLKVADQFRKAGIEPKRMVLEVLPVIPPDLRPMVQLEGGRFATSDLNDLYRRVINRNNRLKRLLDLGAPEIIVRNEKRMLQESVDSLFDSSKQKQKTRITRGKKELKSISDMIKGKQGTFRLNLLGKRVDYSGRGVIINGPKLKLNECGIPKEMALELFKPFVLREIMLRGYSPNPKSAKTYLEQRSPEVWEMLEDVVTGHPVLLNRAPTLWRLGIQAFYPKLIEGNSIRLHLCVCLGFNADFDGDQMAVHVPLTKEAVEEAKTLMISTNNLLNPSNGSPMSIPHKIMLYGIYYMTSINKDLPQYEKVIPSVDYMYYLLDGAQVIGFRQSIKLLMNGEIVETSPGRIIFNEIMPKEFGFVNRDMDKKEINSLLTKAFETIDHEVVVKLIDDLKNFGLEYGTKSGQSVALSDIKIPESVPSLIEKGKQMVNDIDRNFKRGLITYSEVARLTGDAWYSIMNEVGDAVWNALDEKNPLKVLIASGSTKASRSQINQIAGIKGLVSDATGKTVLVPILGNYKLGLSGLEYFVGARGARKTLIDKGLKTADAGYLTRRLVDVAQELIIREEDCGTQAGRTMIVGEGTMLTSFEERLYGRFLAKDLVVDGKKIAKAGENLNYDLLKAISTSGAKEMVIRSPMSCRTKRGICQKCYGLDLITRKTVNIGTAIGVAAAQSIGEPGTQLTMRTFHTGGIAGKDITSGLPRVEEVVEARTPKSMAVMSELDGTATVFKAGDERKIIVKGDDNSSEDNLVEYSVDPVMEILVKDGERVRKGQKLTSGNFDLRDLLSVVGVDVTQKYIIQEVQDVYASQGVNLNDKHIEVIVKQMFRSVKITEVGDTEFLPGEIISLPAFEEQNEKVIAAGGEPAIAELHLLGITKSSLISDSFLAAASFIQTSNVLTDAAASGRVDELLGLKENVIIGKLIPTGESAKLN